MGLSATAKKKKKSGNRSVRTRYMAYSQYFKKHHSLVVPTLLEGRNYVHRYDHSENKVKAAIHGGNNEPFVNTGFIYQHLDGILRTVVHSQLNDLSEMVHFSDC